MPPFARLAQNRAVRLAALSCFLTTMPVYSPNVMALSTAQTSDLTGAFSRLFLLTVAACCALFAAVAIVRRWVRAAPVDTHSMPRILHVAACALYGTGCAGYFVSVAFFADGPVAFALQPLFALLSGIAFTPVAIGWARTARTVELGGTLAFLAAATCVAAACGLVLNQLPKQIVSVVYLVFLTVGILVPLAADTACDLRQDSACDQDATRGQDASRSRSADALGAPGQMRAATLRAFASVMGTTLLGVALSSLVMAIAPTFLLDRSVGAPETGMLVAGFVLLPIGLSKKRRSVYPFAYQAVLPAAAAVALVAAVVCQVVTGWTSADALSGQAVWIAPVVQAAALLVAHTLFALTTILAVATACAVSGAREFSRVFVFCALIGCFTLCAVIGIGIGSMLRGAVENHAPLTLLLTFAYSAFILLSGCVKAWHLTAAPQHEAPAANTADAGNTSTAPGTPATPAAPAARPRLDPSQTSAENHLDARIARVADTHGLTQREREILGYLGRGYGSSYVAKTLLISENTARTHIRNIHRKLGVSTRDELLQLVLTAGDGKESPTQ